MRQLTTLSVRGLLNRRSALGLEGEVAETSPPVILENPPALERDHVGALATQLLLSAWESPQSIMLGKVECKSPDRLTVIQVGKWDVWHREYRQAVEMLSSPDRKALFAWLHHEPRTRLVDGKWEMEPPPTTAGVRTALERLWEILATHGYLHPCTHRNSTKTGL